MGTGAPTRCTVALTLKRATAYGVPDTVVKLTGSTAAPSNVTAVPAGATMVIQFGS
jgi:hypothetical protein